MPIYEYKCSTCGKTFEKIQKFSDAPLEVHEGCGGARRKTDLEVGPTVQRQRLVRHRLRQRPGLRKAIPEVNRSPNRSLNQSRDSSDSKSNGKGSEAKTETKSTSSESKSESKPAAPPQNPTSFLCVGRADVPSRLAGALAFKTPTTGPPPPRSSPPAAESRPPDSGDSRPRYPAPPPARLAHPAT